MATRTNAGSTSPTLKPFQFLALPPEIRNMIYGLLTFDVRGDGNPVYKRSRLRTPPIPNARDYSNSLPQGHPWTDVNATWFYFKRTFEPQILLTNRQIKNEAISIIYSNLEIGFDIRHHQDPVRFGRNLHLSPLDNVQVCCLCFYIHDLMTDLRWYYAQEEALQQLNKDMKALVHALRSIPSLRELKVIYNLQLDFLGWGPINLGCLRDCLITVWSGLLKGADSPETKYVVKIAKEAT
ncbi:MAG: hypothetical protein M1836_002524 [Candelina mexicana]|nr:MAG: hypothetical protein M1836_002524 [Candelina mexicana]